MDPSETLPAWGRESPPEAEGALGGLQDSRVGEWRAGGVGLQKCRNPRLPPPGSLMSLRPYKGVFYFKNHSLTYYSTLYNIELYEKRTSRCYRLR